jgi:hypothetical protein
VRRVGKGSAEVAEWELEEEVVVVEWGEGEGRTEWTSSLRFSSTSGCCVRRYMAKVMHDAVVSLPAMRILMSSS